MRIELYRSENPSLFNELNMAGTEQLIDFLGKKGIVKTKNLSRNAIFNDPHIDVSIIFEEKVRS